MTFLAVIVVLVLLFVVSVWLQVKDQQIIDDEHAIEEAAKREAQR